jgi:hypothetical protein
LEQFSPRHDDHVEAGRELIMPENLSYQSFSTISLNRSPQFFRRRDSQAADGLLIGQDEKRAVASADSGTVCVHPLKFGAVTNALVLPEPPGRDHDP